MQASEVGWRACNEEHHGKVAHSESPSALLNLANSPATTLAREYRSEHVRGNTETERDQLRSRRTHSARGQDP
jgi:hypothetical protein